MNHQQIRQKITNASQQRSIQIGIGTLVVLIIVIAIAATRGGDRTAQIAQSDRACLDFQSQQIVIDEHEFRTSVATSPEAKEQGLSGCTKLPTDAAMYFPYDPPKETAFWMKGMLFPIDILWVSEGKVAAIKQSAPAPADPNSTEGLPIYQSPGIIDGVIEINANQAAEKGIEVGSTVEFK